MASQVDYLHDLLYKSQTYKDVINAMDNLQDMDKYVLQNFNPKLVPLFSRLENVDDIEAIYNEIPPNHKYIDKLPRENAMNILRIINEYPVNVNVYPEIKKHNLDIIEKSIQLRKEFNQTYTRIQYPYENSFEIIDTSPPVHCNRRHQLAAYFKLPYEKVYVSEQTVKRDLILFEEVFANTLSSYFEIYDGVGGVNQYIWNVLQLFTNYELEPVDVLLPLKELATYIQQQKLGNESLVKFLEFMVDALQKPSIEQHLQSNGYVLTDTMCSRVLLTSLCRDRQIEYDYIEKTLRPLLAESKSFEVDPEHSASVHLFLDAFPYHSYHYCYIKFEDGKEIVMFDKKNTGHVEMVPKTIEKFTGLLQILNLNLPYQMIDDLTKSMNFSVDECISLFPYVLDFKNYICAFLASLICRHSMNIFDIVQTRLQYQLVKCLPMNYHVSMQTDICKYAPIDPRQITLRTLYPYKETIDLVNYDQFVNAITHIKNMVKNRSHLYLICSQISYNEFYIYEYLARTEILDSTTTLILIRLLLNNAQISESEKNVLHYLCKMNYVLSPTEREIGFPETHFSNRTMTNFDLMSIDEYFANKSNESDIPLVVEEVDINQLESFISIV